MISVDKPLSPPRTAPMQMLPSSASVKELQEALAKLSLDTRGHKDELRKRLRKGIKKAADTLSASLPEARPAEQFYDAYLVVDFEATCKDIKGLRAFAYPNEIIEFPAILLKWRRLPKEDDAQDRDQSVCEEVGRETSDAEGTGGKVETDGSGSEGGQDGEGAESKWVLEIVDEYRSFVRPKWRPQLTSFCKTLTGITQDQVNPAPSFPEVLNDIYNYFIAKHNLFTKQCRTIWVCDGPWDMRDFVAKSCYINQIVRPTWLAGDYVDLRHSVGCYIQSIEREKKLLDPPTVPIDVGGDPPILAQSLASKVGFPTFNATSTPTNPPSLFPKPPPNLSLEKALEYFSLGPFVGRQHSGIDDSRNIARILIELTRRGWVVKANERVERHGEKTWSWMKGGGIIKWKDREEDGI